MSQQSQRLPFNKGDHATELRNSLAMPTQDSAMRNGHPAVKARWTLLQLFSENSAHQIPRHSLVTGGVTVFRSPLPCVEVVNAIQFERVLAADI